MMKIIILPLPFGMGRVNCYLIRSGDGFVLIDTGGSNNRRELARELEQAGCGPGDLKLILLTHGDFDHSGNAAYLRNAHKAKIVMHKGDAGMVEQGDMFVGRNKPNILIRTLIPFFTGFGRKERFSPDLLVTDGDDLCEYGLDARIVEIPGHSQGSIGIFTADGDFFCGDLLDNLKEPALTTLADDRSAVEVSLRKMAEMGIAMVYPGHGTAFPMQALQV